MKKILLFLLLSVIMWAKAVVSVSILPQKYFINQICGDLCDTEVMISKGSSPATYEPKPKQMLALQKSIAYFAIGVGYEKNWLEKFKKIYPNLTIVKTQKGIKKSSLTHHHDSFHGNDFDKENGLDPHIWLDPILVKIQAENIANALISLLPRHEVLFKKNLQDFLQRLDKINIQISQFFEGKKNKTFLLYHPSWGYFAKRYGLTQIAIETEGKEPKAKDLQNFIVKYKDFKAIFVQPQFSLKSAKLIANAIGCEVKILDILSQNWEEEMLKNAKIISHYLD